jgi:hypothetical protein
MTSLNIHPPFLGGTVSPLDLPRTLPRPRSSPHRGVALRKLLPPRSTTEQRASKCKAESGGGAFGGGCLSFRQRGVRTPADALDFGSSETTARSGGRAGGRSSSAVTVVAAADAVRSAARHVVHSAGVAGCGGVGCQQSIQPNPTASPPLYVP